MTIKLGTEMLKDELDKLVKIIPKKEIKPVLSGILFELKDEKLYMKATDMENSMCVTDAPIEAAGDNTSFVVDAKMIHNIIKSTTESVVTFVIGKVLTIKAGHSTATLPVMDAEGFPELQFSDEEAVEYKVKHSALKTAIDKVSEYASKDEMARHLNSVLFDFRTSSLLLVAADSFRMSVVEIMQENETEREFLLNLKGVKQLRKILDSIPPQELTEEREVKLRLSSSALYLLTHRMQYAVRLTDANFPPWEDVIPDSFNTTVEANAKELRQEMEIPALMAPDAGDTMLLEIADNRMHIKANSPDRGQANAVADVEQDGRDLTIAFDPEFILTALKSVEGDAVLSFVDGDSALKINPKDDEQYVQIIMPVKQRR